MSLFGYNAVVGRKALIVGPISKYVAKTLSDRREEVDISLRALASKVDVSHARIRRILAAETVMTVDELEALAVALGLIGWMVMREAEDAYAADMGVVPFPSNVTENPARLAAKRAKEGPLDGQEESFDGP